MINIQTKKNKSGFIILFAVTLASLLLSIALGIGNVVFREATFSVSGKDSNEAFLAADTATECVLFHDKLNGGVFPLAGPAPASISCGGNTINVTGDFTVPKKAFYRFTMQNLGSAGTGCATMRLEKDGTKIPNTYNLISKGYNSDCPNLTLGSTNPHLVEREIIITSSVGTPPSFQPAPASVSLSAVSPSIPSNSATTLVWSTHGVVNCSATSIPPGYWSGLKPFGNGSETTGILTVNQDYTYTLTCDDAQDNTIKVAGSAVVSVTAPTPIALVSQSTGSATSGSVVSVSIPTPAAGNTLILTYGSSPNTTTVTSVSGGGVTWTKAQSSTIRKDAEIWYGKNSSGSGNTITINLSANVAGSGGLANVSEWSGLPATLDVSGSTNGATSAVTTSNLTTGFANELLIAIVRNGTSTGQSIPANSFTSLNSPDAVAFQAAYRIVSPVGTYSTGWTLTNTTGWEAEIAAFRGN